MFQLAAVRTRTYVAWVSLVLPHAGRDSTL